MHEPIIVAIALSLYAYNVDAGTRADKLYKHFDGACLELDELVRILMTPYAATALPQPTAPRSLM